MSGSEDRSGGTPEERAELRARLEEVDDTLQAIRRGDVDAVVIDGEGGPQVYILEEAGSQSNRFRSDILARINDAVIAVDAHERVLYLNAAAERNYGVTASEVLGQPLGTLYEYRWLHDGDAGQAKAALEEAGHWRGENVHIKRDGTSIHVESSVSRLISDDGSLAGLLAVVRDVTERNAAETALRESEERFRTLFDSIDEAFCVIEMIYDDAGRPCDYRFLQASPSLEKQTGLRDVVGRRIREFSPRHEDYWFEIYDQVATSGERLRFEHRARELGRWFDVCAVKFGKHGDRQVAVLCSDITARKDAEETLRRNQALFSDIIDQAPGGVIVADENLHTLQVNATAQPTFSSVRPLIGRPLPEVMEILWNADAGARLVEDFRHTLETGEPRVLPEFTEWRADLGIRQSFDWETRRIVLPSGKAGVVGYFTDITEKTKAADALRASEQALAEHAAKLQTADRSKDEFLAMLAHELRNPLAPLRNAAALLQNPSTGADQRDQVHSLIARQIENMSRMIDDLLDVSRITQGKIELRKESVAVGPILTTAAEGARELCRANGQQLALSVPDQPLIVNGDPTRLEQVIGNLLSNACKYSGEGTRITLSAEKADGSPDVLIRVNDNGIGIDSELMPRIFELFVQSSRSLDRAHGGLGIGLTVVHRLVRLHGGTIEAHSEGPGRGTEFKIRLPLVDQAVAPARGRDAPAAPPKGRRMLIVDDNRDSADSMAMLQEMCGHEVRVAYDGPEAVALAASFPAEVVLLDIGLPGMDGYEVAGRLRRMRGFEKTFMVALTGYGGDEDQQKARDAGFDRHLVKPANLDLLRQWVEELPDPISR